MMESLEMADNSSPGPSLNDKFLFWASFLTLIAAGIGLSVRSVIIADWGSQFGFTQSELGTITGGGFIGFGVAIIFFSFFSDLFGYGKLMLVAFLLHACSAVVTFAATPIYAAYGKEYAFICLNIGMWLFALGNGTCEAVINPLTASLFPKNKTHWLNILHAGWPLGLILGVVITLGFGQFSTPEAPIRWEFKLGVFLVPVLLYGILMFNRRFPRSEAESAGVSLSDMTGTVGFLGFAVAALFLGFALPTLLDSFGITAYLKTIGVEIPSWIGFAFSGVVWFIYTLYCRFAPGSLLIAFLYLMHALVGYVELGTDSWITNITKQVLGSQTNAELAFMWTNILMFTLRFFAGPIVERINPIGLLLFSAVFGTIGLALLGLPLTDTVWPWVAAVTIYGIGKTFYWPTLLGVISERFPKGGALALGLSGGVGMISAGFFGGPGIGYKQDYLAVEKIQELSPPTYARYRAEKQNDFPLVTQYYPTTAPKISGLDNAKLKVYDDYRRSLAQTGEKKKFATTLEADIDTIQKEEAAGRPVEAKFKEEMTARLQWWNEQGKPNFQTDTAHLEKAIPFGAKTALLYTSAVPAALAVGFLILILYFAATGGYKQVHLEQGGKEVEE